MINIHKIIGLSVITSGLLCASGWRIPEQSANSVALSGAYIANANGAEASYYNPANISFNENTTEAEISVMGIALSAIDYTDNQNGTRTSAYNGSSKTESFLIPTLFMSTEDYNNDGIRYGFSITAPGGLSKRWDSTYQKNSAEEFSLKIVELNPTISYKISNKLSIAGGVRLVHSEGVVKSDGIVASLSSSTIIAGTVTRDMHGDSQDFGYNLALSYLPSNDATIGVTYRSKIDLTEEGKADLSNGAWVIAAGQAGAGTVVQAPSSMENIDASVTVPLPAVLTFSYAHRLNDTTIELTYDRTYWSAYKNLDFDYGTTLNNAVLTSAFDDPKAREWKDTDAFRIGVTHRYNDFLTVMIGYGQDGNPAPEENIGYELPDSDARFYSFGLDYKLDKKSSLGFGYLYDIKESREVSNTTESGITNIDGEFTNAKVQIVSFAYRTTF
jgi:long-chain fatty acid transport protein